MTQPKTVDASFYAVVVPQWSTWQKDDKGQFRLTGAKVDKITQSRPQTVRGGGVVTRITIRMDSAALLPLQPEAVIHIHPGQVEVIHAEAESPDGSDDQE